jgi:hypothetical protein
MQFLSGLGENKLHTIAIAVDAKIRRHSKEVLRQAFQDIG